MNVLPCVILYRRKHYKEYLVNLINENNLDPFDIMETNDITNTMTRHKVKVPKMDKKEKEKNYMERLRKVIFHFA